MSSMWLIRNSDLGSLFERSFLTRSSCLRCAAGTVAARAPVSANEEWPRACAEGWEHIEVQSKPNSPISGHAIARQVQSFCALSWLPRRDGAENSATPRCCNGLLQQSRPNQRTFCRSTSLAASLRNFAPECLCCPTNTGQTSLRQHPITTWRSIPGHV